MPGMSGIELASQIRLNQSLAAQPRIILISAFHRLELTEKPGAEHVDRILSKPVSPSHLFDAIMECFGEEVATSKERIKSLGYEDDALAPIAGARVLLVEDNEINQQVASELLQQAGLVVDIANHGREAIDMINDQSYDVVLMDIQMPVMDGYAATEHLRNDERHKSLPILAMTANATVEDRDKSLQVGMNAHINKPINPGDLFEALLNWVKPGDRPQAVAAEPAMSLKATTEEALVIEGFDTIAGIQRVGGSVHAYRRLLGKFAANQAASVTQLRAAVADDDQELAVRTAHSLKGSAGTLGIKAVQAVAGELETLLAKDLQGAEESHYAKLEESLEGAIALIMELSAPAGAVQATNSGEGVVDEVLFERLEALQMQLDEFDAEAEDSLEQLRADLAGTELDTLLAPVADLVSAYNMEQAAEQLTQLVGKLREQHSEQ
jgi:polar amino acid transport system substrate-binding protein